MADRDPHDDEPALAMLSDDDDSEELLPDGAESPVNAPSHPIPSMQGPFEESIVESEQLDPNAPTNASPKLSAKARHERLLSNRNYNDSYNAKWRAQPNAKWHPLSKIIAQIAFGVHLLHQQLAKSDEEVVKILQRHVDEVDNFIQNTGEDFDSALVDIQERINYLKLPLEHVKIFDIMLEDRQFRNQIIDGNEKIEQIVERTANLMNDLLTDVHKGVEATAEMTLYLDRIAGSWPDDESALSIFNTMQANGEGWTECFQTLQMKGNSLGIALVQLGSILNEMSKRAGVASRRSVVSRPSSSSSAARHQSRSSHQPTSRYTRPRPSKPLPEDPDLVARAVEATLPRRPLSPKRHPIPFEERWERPRERPETPQRKRKEPQEVRTPPTVAEKEKPPLNPETRELTTFLRDTGPDESPPSKIREVTPAPWTVDAESVPATTPTQKPKRTRSKLKRKPSDRNKKDKDTTKDGEKQASASAAPSTNTTPAPAVKSPPASSTAAPPSRATTRNQTRDVSPSAPDSAYSSGSNGNGDHGDKDAKEKRPTASPTLVSVSSPLRVGTSSSGVTSPPRLPSSGKFSLFPSAANSVMSSRFPSELSLPMQVSGLRHERKFSDAGAAPGPEVARRGSVPAVSIGGGGNGKGDLKRKGSLQSIRRWFSRSARGKGKGGGNQSPEVRRMVGIGESLEVVPEGY